MSRTQEDWDRAQEIGLAVRRKLWSTCEELSEWGVSFCDQDELVREIEAEIDNVLLPMVNRLIGEVTRTDKDWE